MNQLRHTTLPALATGFVVVALLATWMAPLAVGQSAAAEPLPPATSLPKTSAAIEYVGPDTYILLDAEGRPQPVLGMSYEEFVEAWKQTQHAERRDNQPRFTIAELRILGTARADNAELEAEVVVRSIAGGPIKVPIGMEDAILLEEPRIEDLGRNGDGNTTSKSYVSYDAAAGGFVAWIDAPAQQRRKVTLKMLRPLLRDGNQTSVALNLPRALVSRLTLAVPERAIETTASDGVVGIEAVAVDGGARLEVDGPRGDFRLSWTTAGSERPELTTVMSATGAISISIDGHSVRSDALLTVRSYGGSFERFRVRLPPGAQLIENSPNSTSDEPAEYRLVVDDDSNKTASDGGSDSQIVTVELAEKQLGPVEVKLSTEQPLGLTDGEPAVELAGFEVMGAVRQFGDVAIAAADDWQLRWENGPYVRQVERTELAESLRATQPTVAFQFDRQPWSLRAQIAARPMVVHVTPQYTLHVGPDEARLLARLNYQIPGARAFEFRVRLNGWELTPEPIESNGLVDRDRAVVNRDGVLVLPLSQASSRRAEIAFVLRRSLPVDSKALHLPLPIPETDTVATADFNVLADPAIELAPDVAASRGLAPVPVADYEPDEPSQDGVRQFAYRLFVGDALFAARRSIRPRDVSTEVETQLSINWQKVEAAQVAFFDVRYQPLTELAFELPLGWSIIDDQIELVPETPAEEPLIASVTIEPQAHGRPTRIARALLAQPRLGRFRVKAAYEFDRWREEGGVGTNRFLLPQPAATRRAIHRVEVAAAPEIVVSLDPSADARWQAETNSDSRSRLTLIGSGEVADLPMVVQSISAIRPQTTVVERVLLQTWQAGNVLQDRAAIKFRSSDERATVELPPHSMASEVEVLVDGELAKVSLQQEGRMVVSLPAAASGDDARLPLHTLELRYRRTAPAGLVTRLSMTPPQLVGSSALCEVYWHVVLPGDRHVVNTSNFLSPTEPAQWLEVLLGRVAAKSQGELEDWVDATHLPSPAQTQNAYLYSGLAPVSVELITAPRWLLVLGASGAVLLVSSAWIHLPLARRAWLAILMAVIVAGLALAFPTQAVLLGQASVLGLALAALAVVLRRWTGVRTVVATPSTPTGSTNMRMRSSLRTDSYYTPPPAALPPLSQPTSVASHSTGGTPSAPLLVPEVDR